MNRHMRWKLTILNGILPTSIINELHKYTFNIIWDEQEMTFQTKSDDVNSRANIIYIIKKSMKAHRIKRYAIHATEYQPTGIYVEYDSLDSEEEVK